MVFKSRLVNFLFNRSEQNIENILLYNKSKWSLNKFTRLLCLLLIGFLVGNLFGTFLNTIRKYITWDGAIVFFLVIVIEISNYKIYHNKDRVFFSFITTDRSKVMRCVAKTVFWHNAVLAQPSFGKVRIQSKIIKSSFWKYFNVFKIGLMVGFFLDAFKVGS